MAKRYDQKTKDEVVGYVESYNQENGRGGQSAAAKKYNLSPITIAQWLKKAGVATGGKKRKTTGAKQGRKPRQVAVAGSGSEVLKQMLEIQEQIEALQAQYSALKAQL